MTLMTPTSYSRVFLPTMRICILTTVLDPFKGGNHLSLFASLPDTEVTILCNRSKVQPSDLPPGVTVVTIPSRLGPYYYGCSDLFFARSVLRAYPVHSAFWQQFSVIHLNQVMGPALRHLPACGVSVLFFIHHPVTADRCVAVAETRGIQSLLWRLRYALLVRWQRSMCRAASHVATVSYTMKQHIAADYGCLPEKISVVPNGVDAQVFHPGGSNSPTADIISIGSFIHPRKGFRYLLETYRELSKRGKRIDDVGRRSDEQRKALSAISGVTVYGTLSQEALLARMQSAAVLISTSLFEGFGLSLIEALSCGRPAFAFAVGAVSEVLSPVDPSLVIPPRDTHAMVTAVCTYLDLPVAEQQRRGAAYCKAVHQHWSIEQASDALRSLYEKIAGESKK